jgi:hypothetical protein
MTALLVLSAFRPLVEGRIREALGATRTPAPPSIVAYQVADVKK